MASYFGPLASFGTTLLSAAGQYRSGKAALAAAQGRQQAKQLEARSLRGQAGQTRASSQRDASNQRRIERLVQSALLARAAAGGGAMDPSVVSLSGEIGAEGTYRALTALYQGEESARGLEDAATLAEYEGNEFLRAGQVAKKSRNISALTTLMGGFESLSPYMKFGEPAMQPMQTGLFDPRFGQFGSGTATGLMGGGIT